MVGVSQWRAVRRAASGFILAWAIAGAAAAAGAATPHASTPAPSGVQVVRPWVGGTVDLCQVATKVTWLSVTRSKPLNVERFSFPARVTVTKSADVRAAARALCTLPTMPAGVMCPLDLGVDYTLRFSAATEAVEPVTLDVSGCESVKGLGASRWVARSPNFWREFGSALGLHAATRATFVGILTTAGS